MRHSHESLVSTMHSQNKRAIGSAINDRLFPEVQIIMGSLSSGQRDTESEASVNNLHSSEERNWLKTKLTKKDSWSAFNF